MIGERIGRRVIVDVLRPGRRNRTRVLLRCECGHESAAVLASAKQTNQCLKCNGKRPTASRPRS